MIFLRDFAGETKPVSIFKKNLRRKKLDAIFFLKLKKSQKFYFHEKINFTKNLQNSFLQKIHKNQFYKKSQKLIHYKKYQK